MNLRDFWRPEGDNGLGIHLFPHPYVTGDALDPWLARMQAMRLKWTTMLNDDVGSMLKCALFGVQPVVRPFLRCTDDWGDRGIVAEFMLAAGLGPYVQPYNEPELEVEWPGATPDMWQWIHRWAFAAGNIMHHGGWPGIQCLDLDWLRQLLRYCRDNGQGHLLENAWLSVHNYTTNHLPDYVQDYNGWLKPLWFQKVVEEELGLQMPVICSEGGWCVGDDMDNRFPKVDEALHAKYTKEGLEMFRTGVMPNGEALPDWWLSVTPWLIASVAVGGDSAFEANAWYSQWFGKRTQTIEAVKSIPPFIRRFSWDEEPEPEEPEEEPVAYTYELDFARYAAEHPERVGQPISPLVQIGASEAVQRTERGVLWWDGQTTLYVPYVAADSEVAQLRAEVADLTEELRQSDAELGQALARLAKIRTALDE